MYALFCAALPSTFPLPHAANCYPTLRHSPLPWPDHHVETRDLALQSVDSRRALCELQQMLRTPSHSSECRVPSFEDSQCDKGPSVRISEDVGSDHLKDDSGKKVP